MVLVAMAHNDRIDRPRAGDMPGDQAGDVRQAAGRGAFAEVEQEPLPRCLEQETGRSLLADPRNEPQTAPEFIAFPPISDTASAARRH